MGNFAVKLSEDGKWIHSITVFAKWGSHNLSKLSKAIGHTFWRKEEPEKHRYLYLLCSKKDKKKIMNTLIHKAQPYPKDAHQFYPEIQTIEVKSEDKFYG